MSTQSLSIHPRSWPRADFALAFGEGAERHKRNTSKASSRTTKRMRKMLKKYDARQRAWSSMDQKTQAEMRKPGSRKYKQ